MIVGMPMALYGINLPAPKRRIVATLAFCVLFAIGSRQVATRASETRELDSRVPPVHDERDNATWRSENQCGLNSLYVLLRLAGIDVDYHDVRRRYPNNGQPTSILTLQDLASQFGLELTAGKTNVVGLQRVAKPVIAHFETVATRGEASGHYVVVTNVNEQQVTYVDGTTAETRSVSWEDFNKLWTGFVLVHDRTNYARLPISAIALFVGVLVVVVTRVVMSVAHRLRTSPSKCLREPQ
jgi:hypothetical protein